MLSSFDKKKMKGPFHLTALPPSTQSIPRELNQARCWKLGNEVVNLFPSSYNPFYTRGGLQGPQTTHLSFQSHSLWGVQCTGQTLCSPLHISLLTITHLFCRCMCYKLDSSSLSFMSPCWKCYTMWGFIKNWLTNYWPGTYHIDFIFI